jgi:RHS repeat-associated protein
LRYEEKDWLQPNDPNTVVDEEQRNPKPKKNESTSEVTATLPITDVRGLGEAIQVELRLESSRAVPGGELRGNIYVGSGQAQAEVTLTMNLPKGLSYVAESSANAVFDAKSNDLTWRIDLDESGLATLPFALNVQPDIKRAALKLDIKAPAKDKREYQIGKAVKVRVADVDASQEMDSAGGKLSLDNGRVQLDFGAGALKDKRNFVASVFKTDLNRKDERASDELTSVEDFSPLTFEVTPDTTFETPITATISLAGLIPAEMLAKGLVPELRYARPGELDVEQTDARGNKRTVKAKGVSYESVPGHWDPVAQVLTVPINHFSTYPVGFSVPSGAPQPWKLSANMGDVSLYRGAMNWSQPIAVPGFPTGAPGLSIAYSSASADSGGGRQDSSDYRLGWGWDVNGVPHIQQGAKTKHEWNGSDTTWYTVQADGYFKLSLGGRDYNLVYKGTTNGADEYVPEDYAPVRAIRCKTGGVDCGDWELPASVVPTWTEVRQTGLYGTYLCAGSLSAQVPAEQYYWQVWTADGTRYVFGTNAASTQHMHDRDGYGTSGKIYYQKWYLTRVADLVRDNPGQNKWSAEYSYEEDPRVGDNGAAPGSPTCVGKGADWEVRTRLKEVSYGNSQASISRPYKVTLNYTTPYTANQFRLSEVIVTSNNANLRRYALGFNGAAWDARLSSITEQGWNGGGWTQLPATTFSYKSDNPNDGTVAGLFKYGLINVISNGYGGQVEHDYYWWSGTKPFNTVLNRRLKDGLGNTTLEQYNFVGGTQCHNDLNAACWFGRDSLFEDSRGGIVGFSTVWKTVSPNGGGALAVTKYDNHHNKRWLGKPAYVRAYNAAQNSVLSTQVNYYGLTEPAPGQPAGTWLTWLGTQDEFPQTDVNYGGLFKRTETTVDGLGNPLSIYEHGYYNLTGDERSTHRGYVHNWSNWVVSKLAWENVYTSITGNVGGSNFRTQTILYYDGNPNYWDTPTLGQLKKAGRGNSGVGGVNWAVHDFAYDGAGNLNWIRDPRGYISTAYYDDATLKPLWTESPLWTGLSYARTTYYYFGRNAGHPGGQPWGEYHYAIDPNGPTVNRVWYDPYGRPEKVIQPGDSDGEPTQKYIYGDAGLASVTAPLKIETQQRENCNGCYIVTQTYYDGLGRAVQTRAEAAGGQQRVTNTIYDALGRSLRQFVPAYEANSNYNRPAGWDTRPNTLNTYDMLGRVTQVTGPDGVATTMGYGNASNMAYVTTTNARGVPQNSLSDGLGQLRQVQECHDADLSNGVQCSWQTTSYNYDAVYGLTQVTDAAGNVSSMGYDWLGRKTSMSDPDMGAWQYGYDANGNLISQRDAKLQWLYFAYDALNRMTHKRLGDTNWGQNVGTIAQYWYDETSDGLWNTAMQNTVGRRTAMIKQDPATGNWENWVRFYYDGRGRTTSTRHELGLGVNNTLVTSYAYDSADRVFRITYPDNEQVTTYYDAAGQPDSMSGTNTYVNGTSYNALGQMTDLRFSNTLRQRYYYYGSNLSAPHVVNGNANWAYGKLRQTCVVANVSGNAGECFDWGIRESGSSNTLLNLYNNYDLVGNVTQVYDRGTNNNPNFDHAYTYDALDRLTNWAMTGSSTDGQSYAYNAIGNLTSKTGLGTLSYPASGPGSVRPHAVTSVSAGPVAEYDDNGNMTRRWSGVWYRHDWNADNKMTTVKDDVGNVLMSLTYDADGARVKSVVNGVTTLHVGNHYEVKDTPNTWVNVTFAKTVGVSVSGSTLTRNTGNNNWGGSGASSTAYCMGGVCAAYASAAATNTDSIYGLSNSDPNAHYNTVRYGLHLKSNGTVVIYELGVNKGTVGSYGVGDRFSVQVDGDNKVRYYRLPNGSSNWQLLYTSTDTPTYPLRMDSAIYTNGGQLVNMQMYGTQLKTTTSYYYLGGQRVAMRTPTDGLQWLHSDHLGSASLATTGSGGAVANSSQRYKPFGELRVAGSGQPSKYTFTGQYDFMSFGLMDYGQGTRFYSPLLGRFTSPDTIVPRADDPQSLNRFSYVRNSPLTRIDPNGHTDTSTSETGQTTNAGDELKKLFEASISGTELGDRLLDSSIDILSKIEIVFSGDGFASMPLDNNGKYRIFLPERLKGSLSLDNRDAAKVAHEVFHAFQREVAAPGDTRKSKFTSLQFEREALIYQYSLLGQLETRSGKDFKSSAEHKWLKELQASEKRAFTWITSLSGGPGAVYRLTANNPGGLDSRFNGNWQKAMQALGFTKSEINLMVKIGR